MKNVRLMCPSKSAAQINSRPCLSPSLFLSPPIYLSIFLILRHHHTHTHTRARAHTHTNTHTHTYTHTHQIVKINGQDVRGLEMNQVLGLIKGAPGTMVSQRERERERERELFKEFKEFTPLK
jgi:hypothetical protein